jgi:hypothetical protein
MRTVLYSYILLAEIGAIAMTLSNQQYQKQPDEYSSSFVGYYDYD